MNKGIVAVLVLIALFVGAYAGYSYEKNKFTSLMTMMQTNYQQQLDAAKMKVQQQMQQTTNQVVMMAKGVVTGPTGMTLYTFDKDTQNKSNCTGQCAVTWPPYLVTGNLPATLPAHVNTFKRPDGSMQYAWDGKPLYYYQGDKNAGDMTGDGIGGVWHVVK